MSFGGVVLAMKQADAIKLLRLLSQSKVLSGQGLLLESTCNGCLAGPSQHLTAALAAQEEYKKADTLLSMCVGLAPRYQKPNHPTQAQSTQNYFCTCKFKYRFVSKYTHTPSSSKHGIPTKFGWLHLDRQFLMCNGGVCHCTQTVWRKCF